MRKIDIVNNVVDKTGISKSDVLVTVETLLLEIKNNLLNGDSIFLRGFGTFLPKKRAAKLARNITKNTTVKIAEHYIPFLKPAKSFNKQMKKCTAEINKKLKKTNK
ncbi:MAG: HU family DNA-binding protein [Phycisphaerales bacterium]|nr:HU family DNA-binding protein [Phycisphaerales bacterium]